MKYIKLFMLLAFVSVFAACSDDDSYNTNGETTVSFASATVTTKESAGLLNIPINVEGARNGNVSVVIKAEEIGDTPAKEDVNYMITDKTLNLNTDTLTSGTINVETKIIDDADLNADRTFKLTIVKANGAKIGENASTIVTIRDNESAFYEQFFGTWKVTGMEVGGQGQEDTPFSADITISGETDETNANYDHVLNATAADFFNIGAATSITFEWHFNYSYDKTAKTGTIGFVCGEQVASYGNGAYTWCWLTDDGRQLTTDNVEASWTLTEDDKLPSVITFTPGQVLYMYQPGRGYWAAVYDIKMTKK